MKRTTASAHGVGDLHASRFRAFCSRAFSWQVPRSCRFLQLLDRRHVRTQSLAVRQLSSPVAPFSVQEIEQAGGAALVGVLADVARVLRLFQISGNVKLDYFVVAPDRF